jgi:hypothetical protein
MSRLFDAWRALMGNKPDVPPPAAAPAAHARDDARAVRALNRHLRELRALLQQQADFTTEALTRAGWQSDLEAAQQRALHRALNLTQTRDDVIVGPWTGEVGFELLYWIPFLNWLVDQGLDPSRLIVVSRGGTASWYRHLTTRYVDLLDLVTADEFREETAGPKKQMDREREFDRRMVETVRARLGLPNTVPVLHPAAMFRLFASVWRKRASIELVETFTRHAAMASPPLEADERPAGLPDNYVVARFYFSKAFPDAPTNRRLVAELLRTLSAQAPVALVATRVRLDEHSDFQSAAGSNVFVIDPHTAPSRNLDVQTRLIAGSRGFVGTYGGFSYLAPLLGKRSLSFFSRRAGFEAHHLELAHRVFDRVRSGSFLALHTQALDLVQPTVTHWLTGPDGSERPQADAATVDALT